MALTVDVNVLGDVVSVLMLVLDQARISPLVLQRDVRDVQQTFVVVVGIALLKHRYKSAVGCALREQN